MLPFKVNSFTAPPRHIDSHTDHLDCVHLGYRRQTSEWSLYRKVVILPIVTLFTNFIINNVLRQLENRGNSALGVTLPLLLPFNSGIEPAELRCQRLVALSTKRKDRHLSETGF